MRDKLQSHMTTWTGHGRDKEENKLHVSHFILSKIHQSSHLSKTVRHSLSNLVLSEQRIKKGL